VGEWAAVELCPERQAERERERERERQREREGQKWRDDRLDNVSQRTRNKIPTLAATNSRPTKEWATSAKQRLNCADPSTERERLTERHRKMNRDYDPPWLQRTAGPRKSGRHQQDSA
jgi:hypothetical protein